MSRTINILLVAACFMFLYTQNIKADAKSKLLESIDKLALLGNDTDTSLTKEVARLIETDPQAAIQLLLPKLKEPNLTEGHLAVYGR